MTIPAPISPIGQVYTVAQPIKATVQNPLPCSAQKVMTSVTLSWVDTGASQYEIWVSDGCTMPPSPTINADVVANTHCSGGVCTYTPPAQMAASLQAAWWVREAGGPWAAQGTLFSINYIGVNSYTSTAGVWRYSTDGIGVGTRIVDYSSSRTGLDYNGGFIFPKGQWATVSVAGIVPPGALAIDADVQLIQTIDTGQPTLGFKTRRHTSPVSEDPEPYGGAMYTTASRATYSVPILLGPDLSFDFCYSDAFNGAAPSGTVTGRAVTVMIMGVLVPS